MVGLGLQLPASGCLVLYCTLHLVYLLPPLCDSVLDFLGLLAEVEHGSSLHVALALLLGEFVRHSFEEHVGGFALVNGCFSGFDLVFLVFPELEFELEKFLAFFSVHVFTLFEMSNLDHELLLVHLPLHLVEHGYWDVVDDLELLVYLGQHSVSYVTNNLNLSIQI